MSKYEITNIDVGKYTPERRLWIALRGCEVGTKKTFNWHGMLDIDTARDLGRGLLNSANGLEKAIHEAEFATE